MAKKKRGKKKPAPNLTPKQRRFAEEYLLDLNAVQAAVRAGYTKATASSQAAQLLKKPAVRKLVDELVAERSKRTQITTDRVLEELAHIAFSSVEHYEGGEADSALALKPGAPLEAMRAVSSVKKTILMGDDDDVLRLVKVEFRLWDKPKALALCMRNLGMLNDKLTVDLDEELRKVMSEVANTYDSKLSRLAGRKQAK